MSHVPTTDIHRFVGDPYVHQITVTGLTAAQVTVATWRCRTVSKAIGTGITVVDDGGVARLDVDITKTDTEAIGVGMFAWQAAAGGTDPPVVAVGVLRLDARL